MAAGVRDTWVIFEERETTQDATYGTSIEGNWTERAAMWAEVQDVLPSRSERVEQSVSIASRPARIRVDYLDGADLNSSMRIDIDGRKLRIIGGPAERGHRKEWEMMAEQLTTEGQEP